MMRDLNNISKDILICGCYTIKDSDENDVTVTRPLFPLHIQEIMQYNVLHAGQSGTIISQSGYQERGHQKMAQNILFCCFFPTKFPPFFLFREKTRQCQTGK